MQHSVRKIQREERGSALLEVAIVCTLFWTMLFGICGFGHALYAYDFVLYAAKSATRWAAVNGSTCASDGSCTSPAQASDVQCYVVGGDGCLTKGIVPPGIDPKKLAVTTTWCNPNGPNGPTCPGNATPTLTCTTTPTAPSCPVQVKVCYDFSFIVPLIPVGSGASCSGNSTSHTLTLSGTSEMVIAH